MHQAGHNFQPLSFAFTAIPTYNQPVRPFENVEKRLLSSVQSWYSGALPKASKPRSFSYNVAATPKWAPSCQLLRERKISTVSNGFSKGKKAGQLLGSAAPGTNGVRFCESFLSRNFYSRNFTNPIHLCQICILKILFPYNIL